MVSNEYTGQMRRSNCLDPIPPPFLPGSPEIRGMMGVIKKGGELNKVIKVIKIKIK